MNEMFKIVSGTNGYDEVRTSLMMKNANNTLEKKDEFWYISRNDPTVNITDDMIDETIDYIRDYVINLYMRSMVTFDVPDYWFDTMFPKSDIIPSYPDMDNDMKIMGNILRRLMKKYPAGHFTWKIRSDRCIMYLEVREHHKLFGESRIPLEITMFDPHDNIMQYISLTVDDKYNWYCDKVIGPFYVLADKKDLSKILNPVGAGINPLLMNGIKEAFRMYRSRIDDYDTDGMQTISRMYSRIELDIFKKVMKNTKEGILCPGFKLLSWKGFSEYPTEQFKVFSRNNDKGDNSKDTLVDLTDSEWGYVERYINKIGILNDDEPKHINLIPYLELPRYGSALTIDIGTNNHISTYIDYEDDIMRVYMSQEIKEDIRVISHVDFKDIRSFNIHNLVHMDTDVLFKSPDKIAKSMVSLTSIISSYFTDDKKLLNFAIRIIGLWIVIHDRPRRTRLVEVQRRGPYAPANYKTNDEKEFATTRILRPVKEAKEMVERQNKEGGSKREFLYTLPDWPRAGCEYTNKNNKLVKRRATTCHRHLPLNNEKPTKVIM